MICEAVSSGASAVGYLMAEEAENLNLPACRADEIQYHGASARGRVGGERVRKYCRWNA
jgi:hypothetical protein